MTQELVTVNNGEIRTTTLAIAEGTNNEHASVMLLVRKYQPDLEVFGLVDFKSQSSGGRPTEYATLNERQSTLIMSYMKNTAVIRQFKTRLVKTFYEMAESAKALPVIHDPQTRALIQLLADNDAIKQEQKQHRTMIEDVSSKVDSLTPIHSMSVLNTIQGAISTAAKWYRATCVAKHVPIKQTEAQGHVLTMLLEREGVADIGYIRNTTTALNWLRKLAGKYQEEYNAWVDRNSLFAKSN